MRNPLLKSATLLLTALLLQNCSTTGIPSVTPQASGQESLPLSEVQPAESAVAESAVKVEILQEGDSYKLLRGGEPYYIKGAGGWHHFDQLAASGGNSVRTWSTQWAEKILDEAHQQGLTVTLGLDVARERHGFNYDDSTAVAQQLERLRADVRRFKDHPALLLWGIGNELNLHYSNPKVWNAVNDIARMIHEEDPNHPATTMLAGPNTQDINHIKERAPALDLLSINAYSALPAVAEQLRLAGWDKAYIITEWGPTGHWEVKNTPWGAPIEENSSQKAAVYKGRYMASMAQDTARNLGSYVFLWGQKQERTPTWYGLFTESGKTTAVLDVMQYLWTGSWPQNRAPELNALLLAGKQAHDHVYLQPGTTHTAAVYASDPEHNKLSYRWELLEESTDLKEGGDWEKRPPAIEGHFLQQDKEKLLLKAPQKEGAYRLFVYVSDGSNKVATANLPFFVKK